MQASGIVPPVALAEKLKTPEARLEILAQMKTPQINATHKLVPTRQALLGPSRVCASGSNDLESLS